MRSDIRTCQRSEVGGTLPCRTGFSRHRSMRSSTFSTAARSPFRTSLYGLWPFACYILLALPLRAEVFWRLPKTSDAVLRQMGGDRVYATDVQVNGAPGTLAAYVFDVPAARVGADLSRTFGLPPPASFGATFLTHAQKDHLQRLFILPATSGNGSCVVFAFDQPLRDAAQARQPPPGWPKGLPPLNATPVFSAVCALTRTTFVTADSPASPEAAVQEATQVLSGAGWSETVPATATFKIFVSGEKQCVLCATRRPQSDRTTISLLQREGTTP